MNWQKRYEKVKVGDTVRCIKNPKGRNSAESTNEGGGWKEGYTFVISRVTDPHDSNNGMRILWDGYSGCGVFDDYVEIIKKGGD